MTLLPMRRSMRPRPDTFERWHTVDGKPTCTRYTWIEPYPRVPDNPRRALNPLMRFAADVWTFFIHVWGGPRAMLRQRSMTAADWRMARDRIFHIEELVRRVLLIAALTLKLPPPRELTTAHVRKLPLRTRARENPNSPRTWHVSFHAMPADAEPRGDRLVYPRKRTAAPLGFKPTRGLARRLEALGRAITNGRVHSFRLAHRLARIAARNAQANAPRVLAVPYWDFHPLARTPGKHAVNSAMEKAALLSIRVLARWNGQWEKFEPG